MLLERYRKLECWLMLKKCLKERLVILLSVDDSILFKVYAERKFLILNFNQGL